MRWTKWYAVLLAALILALGLAALPRASVAGGNDDVELIQPPGGDNGDPDTGGGVRFSTFRWIMHAGASARAFLFHQTLVTRGVAPSRNPAGLRTRRASTVRR